MTIYTDIDGAARVAPAPLGSSLRYRRLVIAGYVAFDPVALARPSMRPKEIAVLTALLRRARNVLEFRAGGITTLAIKMGVSRLTSVESDADWIARIHADDAAARALEDGRLNLLHADIGPIGRFGGPAANAEVRECWPRYSRAPWDHVDAHGLDLVVIDGRFRVACIMETALQVGRDAIIAVHDFWNRPHYHGVLPFLDEIDRMETLAVFRVKPEIDRIAAEALRETARYIAD